MNPTDVIAALAELLDTERKLLLTPVQGGDTHHCFHLTFEGSSDSYFVKTNTSQHSEVLKSEAFSLRQMNVLFDDAYPEFIAETESNGCALLLMSYHQIDSLRNQTSAELGSLLAKQHGVKNDQCGWGEDNFIGSSPQRNPWTDSWHEFFLQHRLLPQLVMAEKKGLESALLNQAQALLDSPPKALIDHQVDIVLLHGDLWLGNAGYDFNNSKPLLYDPAPYFGDREVDLAMSELFGRFPDNFYKAYYSAHPKQEGYETRKILYNLYHALNHFNLFGPSYHTLVESHLNELL